MTRLRTIDLADGLYHVTTRGNRRESIFADDQDRHRLIATFARHLPQYEARAYAFCLMGNHFHLVVQTRQPNLSRLMRRINGSYAQFFNWRHELTGHLFEGPVRAIHVDRDAYFLAVCRYVEMNPVRAGLVQDPSEWPWSSWRAHAGDATPPPWLDSATLHRLMLGREPRDIDDRRSAQAEYRAFTRAGADDALWERGLRGRIYLGDAAFAAGVQRRSNIG